MADRDEREQQIARIIALVLFDSHEVPPPKCVEAARRIAALPQPITAETVRRIVEIYEDVDSPYADWEAIAHRANVEVKHEG